MFQEIDRVYIRQYLGYADLWLQADPRLESAITCLQPVTDPGGTRPDASAENLVRATIARLIATDASIDALDDLVGTTKTDESEGNPAREDMRLRRKGRMLVYRLAKMLDTEPRGDVFGSSPAVGEDLRATAAYPPFPFGGRTAY